MAQCGLNFFQQQQGNDESHLKLSWGTLAEQRITDFLTVATLRFQPNLRNSNNSNRLHAVYVIQLSQKTKRPTLTPPQTTSSNSMPARACKQMPVCLHVEKQSVRC
jgi:hypothetical protein